MPMTELHRIYVGIWVVKRTCIHVSAKMECGRNLARQRRRCVSTMERNRHLKPSSHVSRYTVSYCCIIPTEEMLVDPDRTKGVKAHVSTRTVRSQFSSKETKSLE